MIKDRIILLIVLNILGLHFIQARDVDLLTATYSEATVKKYLSTDNRWVNYPDYTDREGWTRLTDPFLEKLIKDADKYLDYKWQVVQATDYLEYERSGSRVIMEKPLNDNCRALTHLFFAELAEGKGRYIDQIINGSWYMTEISTWSLSAHLPAFQSSKRTLPQQGTHVFDLMAGDIGSLMSWIYYFLQPEFDKVTPIISQRIKLHIQERLIEPYLSRNDMWWQALDIDEGQLVNNWNPWCNFNVLTALLLVEDDVDKKVGGVYKTMTSVDKFINYVKADGACEEGPSYWGHAAGKLYDYLKLLAYATDNHISIFEHPIVKNMGEYISQSYIGGDRWVVNFADASAKGGGDPLLIFRYGEDVHSMEMMQFAKYLTEQQSSFNVIEGRDAFRTLENMICYPTFEKQTPQLPQNTYKWYPETEFLYLKDEDTFFAAKGGYNNESHNHNDIGSFILYKEGKPVFIDAGVGTYTKKTFSNERYNIWTMQSAYHNLPQINGHDQRFGASYKSRDVSFDPKKGVFKLDIAGAYPTEAQIDKWLRSYELKNGQLLIRDDFNLRQTDTANVVHFMVAEKPTISKGIVSLGNGTHALTFDGNEFEASIDTIEQDDPRLSNVWGQHLYRINLKAKNMQRKGSYTFTIE